ncbi:MAG: cryptochrome/photolyase family protein [Flavobacteriia bacterium]|jgi:deoxyribodipyrimidine photolyase-related protein
MQAFLIFPHTLFYDQTHYENCNSLFIIEEYLFFRQYAFHKQKLVFHRATMKYFASWVENFVSVKYIESLENDLHIKNVLISIKNQGFKSIKTFEPEDEWLKKRIIKACTSLNLEINIIESPLFINSLQENENYRESHKNYFQTEFYIHQRKTKNILLEFDKKPSGGKWSFDAENRKKIPKEHVIPNRKETIENEFVLEAKNYVSTYFQNNPGTITDFQYAVTPEEAELKMKEFFKTYFDFFGTFEDAILQKESKIYHSILSPYLNTGILSPLKVLNEAIDFASKNNIPINSLEGFVRQILGWREFIRYVYSFENVKQRTTNFWGFKRKIPASFYTGETGILPLDDCIKKNLSSAYNHHIERLMIIGNFMLLCEFDPDEVYRWFMEMYIDSYDWVMVPNVYAMSQFADGGTMTTKPYISGSNYIIKMSDYSKGPWSEIWDALFWRFLIRYKVVFQSNIRMKMLISTYDKFPEEKKQNFNDKAERFLQSVEKQNIN